MVLEYQMHRKHDTIGRRSIRGKAAFVNLVNAQRTIQRQ